jgi:hypothetical protein
MLPLLLLLLQVLLVSLRASCCVLSPAAAAVRAPAIVAPLLPPLSVALRADAALDLRDLDSFFALCVHSIATQTRNSSSIVT